MAGGGDSEGTFGGNGSVYWKVEMKNVKTITTEQKGNGHYKQEGHNGTRPDGRFTIALKCPDGSGEPGKLAKGLRDAADRIDAGQGEVFFDLPIENGKHEQITINWPSAPEDFTATKTAV